MQIVTYPSNFHDNKPDTRPYLLHDKRARHLHDRIGAGVRRLRVRVLVAVHRQVLLHARDVGVGQVALVEVLHEEAEAADRQDRPVQLAQEPALLGRLEVRVRVPDEGAERPRGRLLLLMRLRVGHGLFAVISGLRLRSSGRRRRRLVGTEFSAQEPLVIILHANVLLVPASASFYSSKISLGTRRVVKRPPKSHPQPAMASDAHGRRSSRGYGPERDKPAPRTRITQAPLSASSFPPRKETERSMQRRCQHMSQSKFRSERRWGVVRVGVVQDASGRDDGGLALAQYS